MIDPHSLLVEDLLRLLVTRGVLANPNIRNRLIYVDPARTDYVVPFNVLATQWPVAQTLTGSTVG